MCHVNQGKGGPLLLLLFCFSSHETLPHDLMTLILQQTNLICQIPLHDIHIHNHNATNNVFSLCKYCYYCSYDPSKCECGWLRAIITLSKV